jgi:3'-phosphoadenosine 5'-phosphosulfate sulfotransferase (PAPS reductase)/FAD synthetase
MKHIVSFSGGRTSAYLVYLMEQKRINEGFDVEYVFMDTGIEHEKTYEFIKKCVDYFKIQITCLKGNFNQPVGEGHTFEVIDYKLLKPDYKNGAYAQMVKKYGVPTVKSAWCSSRMKQEVNEKYCSSTFEIGSYKNVLGIRSDEPQRYYGKNAWQVIKNHPYSKYELYKIFIGQSDLWISPEAKELLEARKKALKKNGISYLAELQDFSKDDVNDFWANMPFDLGIDDHLGNCVFCIKKSVGKIALAQRDEPEIELKFNKMIEAGSSRLNTGKIPKGIMYRGTNSLISIKKVYQSSSRLEIKQSLRSMKDDSSCSESCEGLDAQVDMFK